MRTSARKVKRRFREVNRRDEWGERNARHVHRISLRNRSHKKSSLKQYSLVRVGVAAAAAAGCAVLVVEEHETDGNNADDNVKRLTTISVASFLHSRRRFADEKASKSPCQKSHPTLMRTPRMTLCQKRSLKTGRL